MTAKRINHYVRIYKKTIDKHIPFIVHWELTYRCNLNCIHCYCVRDDTREELACDEIKSILDTLADMGCLYLVLSGGEIFVRDDFLHIAHYARAKGFALRLLTNGTFVTKEIAGNIQEISPISVEMSLYATYAELHDRITGVQGSFEKTINAFSLLRENGVRTKVKSVIMNCNSDQLTGLKKLAKRMGAGIVYDFNVTPKNDGAKDPLAFRLNEGDMYRLLVSNGRPYAFKPRMKINNNTFMCSAGTNNISISPYGDVYPCVCIKELAGNVRCESLEDIINSPVLNKVRTTPLSALWACRRCNLAAYCKRCSGLAILEGGDFTGPSPADCTLAKVRERLYLEKNSIKKTTESLGL